MDSILFWVKTIYFSGMLATVVILMIWDVTIGRRRRDFSMRYMLSRGVAQWFIFGFGLLIWPVLMYVSFVGIDSEPATEDVVQKKENKV